MAIIEDEEENQSTTGVVVEPSSKKSKVSIPLEIIEAILLRLPVESIFRSTAVSKACYSLISHPSFPKLQLTHATSAHRTALFISAYDTFSGKRYYLSASALGGPLTLLLTVDRVVYHDSPSHLNGLVCFTSHPRDKVTPLFINPSTRKIFKLPGITRPAVFDLFGHLYGFDDSTDQHKILSINTKESEFKVFDMSTRSWRKIEAEPPVGFTWNDFHGHLDGGVCFDSKVHVMLQYCNPEQPFEILAFDFVTDKFSLMRIPQDAWPHVWFPYEVGIINNMPFIMKISGSLGVVVYEYVKSEIHIWLLQNYENGVWVKETITLPEPWNALASEFPPSIDANMDANMDDEIVFNFSNTIIENVIIVPVYNRKSKSFTTLEFTLDGQGLSSETLRFHRIMHYVDSIVPV